MRSVKILAVAAMVSAGLLAAPAVQAEEHWRGHEEHRHEMWRGHEGHWEHRDNDAGAAVAGAVIGLGLGALLGGAIASQPAYAAPPPVVQPPPGYYPAPAYGYGYGYPAPQGYYADPNYQ